jgi:hypothetical protein
MTGFFSHMEGHLPLKIAAIALAALLLVPVLTSSLALGDNGQNDRDVSVDTSTDGYFQILSKVQGQSGNAFELQFAGNTLLMTFTNASSQQNISLEFSISLHKLIYTNKSGSNTTLISFEDSGFSLMGNSMLGQYAPANAIAKIFGVFASGNGVIFIMIVQVNGKPVTVTSPATNTPFELLPNEVKVSFVIVTTNLSQIMPMQPMQIPSGQPQGNISLVMSVSSPSATPSLSSSQSSMQLNFGQGDNTGYFAWNRSAYTSNGQDNNWNQSTVHFQFNDDELTLTYPAALKIVHDPVIAVSPQSLLGAVTTAVRTAGNIIIYGIALTLAVVLVASSALYRRRR